MQLVLCFGCFFFFFQAEDGIRDLTVTGVQTCALPILPTTAIPPCGPATPKSAVGWMKTRSSAARRGRTPERKADTPKSTAPRLSRVGTNRKCQGRTVEIGRASCRERV